MKWDGESRSFPAANAQSAPSLRPAVIEGHTLVNGGLDGALYTFLVW